MLEFCGVTRGSKLLGVSIPSFDKALCGRPMQKGTLRLIEAELASVETLLAVEAEARRVDKARRDAEASARREASAKPRARYARKS